MHIASRFGARARRGRERLERGREPDERVRELGVLGVQRRERRALPTTPHCPSACARRDRRAQAFGLLAARSSAPSAIIGSAVASWRSIGGPIDDERPPRRERAEPAHVVDLAERRAARRVDEPPEERAQRALQRRRKLARAVGEALELAQPETRVVRGRSATGTEVGVRTARVERVAAEPDREHLEREIGARCRAPRRCRRSFTRSRISAGARAMSLPGLLEVGLLDVIAGRTRREERAPEAQREGARAALERVHRGRALPNALAVPSAMRRASLNVGRERDGEARGAGVGLLVVVLRGDAHQVLETELEIERIALGVVDDVGDGDDLDPAARLVERARRARGAPSRGARGAAPRSRRGSVAATPERGETARERRAPRSRRRRRRGCASRGDPRDRAARRTDTASPRRWRASTQASSSGELDDRDELARGEEREPLRRAATRSRSSRAAAAPATSPTTQSSSVPSSCSTGPVRRPSARAACTHTSGSGWSSSGCSTWSVRPTSSGSVIGGIPQTLTSRQRAASTRPRSAPCAGPRIIASNVSRDPQSQRPSSGSSSALAPASQIRISRRARASAFSGSASSSTVAEERRARERVDERSFDDAIARDRGDALAKRRLLRRRWRGAAPSARRDATCSRRTTRGGSRRRALRRARRGARRLRRST